MAFPVPPDKRGRASCIVVGLVAACASVAVILIATQAEPTGGGEFRGLNNLPRVMAAMGLLLVNILFQYRRVLVEHASETHVDRRRARR